MEARGKWGWLVPGGLLALSAVPVVAGAVRLAGLAGAATVRPDNARFFAQPWPVVLHVISASVFCVLGAFQFAAEFRGRRPAWHRYAGRLLVPCGLLAGLSGLWMTQFYPPAEADGALLHAFRLGFGSAMLACLVLGLAAIRRRSFLQHRAWMIRSYAIGLGAGTQFVVHVPWLLLVGQPRVLSRALLMGAGWLINVVVAERIIRSQNAPKPREPEGPRGFAAL